MSIIASIFKQFLGEPFEHNEGTGQMSFDCPACGENGKGEGKHKLAVNYNKNTFRCWVCDFENNMHGKVPKLIKRYGNTRLLKEYKLVRPDTFEEVHTQIEVKLPHGFRRLADCNDKFYKYNNLF